MPDVTGTIQVYPQYLLDTFRGGVHQPQTDVLRVGLLRSSYVYDAAHTNASDVTAHEVSGVNGYSRQTLSNVSITNDGTYIRLTANPTLFMAIGGNFSAKYWFMVNGSTPSDNLIAMGQIDDARDDEVVIIDGRQIVVWPNELGLYRLPV